MPLRQRNKPRRMTAFARWRMNRQWSRLRREYPEYVRRNDDGEWEMDMWADHGIFSPAYKTAYARNILTTGRK